MSEELPPMAVDRRQGNEPLHNEGVPVGRSLLEFWQWSASDLVSNATRGRLTEFIVGSALGADLGGVRNEWDAFDLVTPSGIKVEVKSAAYLQSWYQRRPSAISWRTPKTRAWDPLTNVQSPDVRRQADVYVLALLDHLDKSTVDPLDVSQWRFFVVPTPLLDARTRSQHSITLKSARSLVGNPVSYDGLADAVDRAGRQRHDSAV